MYSALADKRHDITEPSREYTYFLPVPDHLSQIGLSFVSLSMPPFFFQKTIEAVHLLLFIKLKFSLIVLRVVSVILAPKKFFFFFFFFFAICLQQQNNSWHSRNLVHLLLLKKQIVAPNST